MVLLFTAMAPITDDRAGTGPETGSPVPGASATEIAAAVIDLRQKGIGATPAQQAVAEALLVCLGRWGLRKTTMDDVAREAGMSRATLYRLYPGGRDQIMAAAAAGEILALADQVRAAVDATVDLEEALVTAVHVASTFLASHEALGELREHDPVAFERLLTFDHLEMAYEAAAWTVGPAFERHCRVASEAAEVAVLIARLVVSHLAWPSPAFDLSRRGDAARLVSTFVLPGLRAEPR